MGENEIIDQSALAQDVASKIKYKFLDHFLVKTLDPIKVTKEFSKPVSLGAPRKDENGIEANDIEKVETEVKEVESDYRKGVVVKLPAYYEENKDENAKEYKKINIGDVVVFRDAAGLRFDLLRDSRLLRLYEILGVEK